MASGWFDFFWGGVRPAAAGALLLLAGAAAAAPAPAPSTPEHEVVVAGHAPAPARERERQLQAFVRRVPALNNGQALARWVKPVCPVVAGMTQEQAEYVLVRLVQVARAAGAPVVDDGRCAANVYIIASADPQALVKAIARRSPNMFAKGEAAAFRSFEETPRPVRAWYNARLDRLTTTGESPFEGLEGLPRNIPVIHHADDTRVRSNSPYALTSAIVVVDSGKVAGMNVGALADYLALASLTQLQPDADIGDAPSILGLFRAPPGSAAPQGLTAWDTAYLYALYHTSLEDLHQGATIAIRMNEALGRSNGAPPAQP
jgi:hypothetical protein